MTRPALLGGALDRLAEAVLVEGADEVQAALHQPAEARVLGHLAEPVSPHRDENRSPARLLGQPLEERAPLLQVVAQGEHLLALVHGEDRAGRSVLLQTRSATAAVSAPA